MSLPEVASREEWLRARKALLVREKELTRQKDALNADRRRLPMVAIEKHYEFEGPQGTAGPRGPVCRKAAVDHPTLHVRPIMGRRVLVVYRRL